ncbi:MAG: polysaccharide deacetylase family protein [Litorimonas sp.]
MIRLILTLLSALLLLACTVPDEPASLANSAPISEKRIALTYDDAPRGNGRMFAGTDRTQALIEQFEIAETGPVAIFVTTRGLDTQAGRDRIHAYANAGHRIANHSHAHMWASRTETSAYIADIDQAEVALDPFANRRAWFRFPYLDEGGYGETDVAHAKRDALRTALSDRDLMSGYVTIDTYDWHLDRLWQDALRDGKTIDEAALSKVYSDMVVDAAEHFDRMAIALLDRRPAQVVLLHENDLAASFTVDMVNALRANGWTLIDPDEAFSDPIAAQLPDTLFSGMGRIAALASDAGRSGADYFDHWSASESGIEARLAADTVFRD